MLIAACATALAGLGLLWPALGAPASTAVGLADGEGPAHLWGLWVAAEGLFSHGPYLRVSEVNYPAGFHADLMDPINLLLFWPFWMLGGGGAAGAMLGWNAVHLMTVVLAGWGGWRLGRTVLQSPQAAAVTAAAVAGAPYLIGAAGVVGRSEYLPLAGWALHLSFLIGFLRTGGRREQLGAIITLTALAHAGWQPLTWLILAELLLVWMLYRTSSGEQTPLDRRETITRMVMVTAPAALLTLPLLLSHLSTDPWWLGRLSHPSPFEERPRAVPLATLLPLIDATRSWANNPLPYLGLTLPALAVVGVIYERKKALRWFALASLVLIFALGEIVAMGTSVDTATNFYYMPAAILMHIIAPLRAFHGWARLTLLVVPLLAICAGYAIDHLTRKQPSRSLLVTAALALLLVLEGVTWSPVGRGNFAIDTDSPAYTALAALPQGPVLELPLGMHQQHADRALLRAQDLQRPTSLAPSPQQPSALNLSSLAWSIEQGTDLTEHRCAASEANRLLQAGFVGVLLHADLLPEGETTVDAISTLLGEPTVSIDDKLAWALDQGDSVEVPIPPSCKTLAENGETLRLKR